MVLAVDYITLDRCDGKEAKGDAQTDELHCTSSFELSGILTDSAKHSKAAGHFAKPNAITSNDPKLLCGGGQLLFFRVV